MQIDARGKACPMPVIMAKKEIDGGCRDLTILVDNQTAVENLTRLGNSAGMTVTTGGEGQGLFVAACWRGEIRRTTDDCMSCDGKRICGIHRKRSDRRRRSDIGL